MPDGDHQGRRARLVRHARVFTADAEAMDALLRTRDVRRARAFFDSDEPRPRAAPGPPRGRLRDAEVGLADLDRLAGDTTSALARTCRAWRIAADIGDLNRRAHAHEYAGLALLGDGRFDECLDAYRRALAEREETGCLVRLSFVVGAIAYALTIRGHPSDLAEADACYRRVSDIDSAIGARQALGRFWGDSAATLIGLGRHQEALDRARMALDENERIGFTRGAALNRIRVAQALSGLDDHDAAHTAITAAIASQDHLTAFDQTIVGPALTDLHRTLNLQHD